ncbi:MAG: hypothetical protein ACYCS4_02925 [Acidimicrobiales bacterium]
MASSVEPIGVRRSLPGLGGEPGAGAHRNLEVVPPRRRRRRAKRYVPMLVAGVLVLGSLLAVTGAQAYLMDGQVRLTTLDHQLQQQRSEQRKLQLEVAALEEPARIVAQAQRQGMVQPSNVHDVPSVNPSSRVPAGRQGKASGG